MWWKNYYRKSASYWVKQQETAVKTSFKRRSNWVLLKSQILILEPVCNQCYTDIIIHVVHWGWKAVWNTTHTNIAEWVNAVKCFSCRSNCFRYWLMPTHHRITERLWLLSFHCLNDPQADSRWSILKLKCYLSHIYYIWVVKYLFL